jgi:spermidine/putrescine transport system ATP-binding protein
VQLGAGIAATVTDVVYQGSFKRVTAAPEAASDIALLARLPATAPVREGTTVSLAIDPEQVIILRD